MVVFNPKEMRSWYAQRHRGKRKNLVGDVKIHSSSLDRRQNEDAEQRDQHEREELVSN